MASKRTVIVTGASQGIGAAVVQAFLDRGYNVVATSRSVSKAGFALSPNLALVDGDNRDGGAAGPEMARQQTLESKNTKAGQCDDRSALHGHRTPCMEAHYRAARQDVFVDER